MTTISVMKRSRNQRWPSIRRNLLSLEHVARVRSSNGTLETILLNKDVGEFLPSASVLKFSLAFVIFLYSKWWMFVSNENVWPAYDLGSLLFQSLLSVTYPHLRHSIYRLLTPCSPSLIVSSSLTPTLSWSVLSTLQLEEPYCKPIPWRLNSHFSNSPYPKSKPHRGCKWRRSADANFVSLSSHLVDPHW